ncbi:adenine deaminase [Deinococcus geothermalis DSM 11300]|uniref:Adenine deaminase n=1 Tax=Deinococcus geothermalis (strain DSM 11300 / CIP 105573 / AG-3a) TaxID=319795 RepID=ADEC_DEIGD|nr:adenine deaminase C-terminal domain-containing protein [Deinococcus geothermalis]Q1J1B1.1 RecName: Full=Adenine deaminase; Short=Adenase; Short=Adenine aminase [Deinococcus geothermalis DSM 11300]ABF44723.1 adenine deaminase [Deinococcus geothermalis DSM 11300]
MTTASAASERAVRQRLVRVARGLEAGDLLVRGAQVVQPATGEVFGADVLVAEGRVAALVGPGLGVRAARTVEARGAYLAPGFLDAHIHIESSLLTPARFAAAVLPRGTTAVVAEPHETVNVMGLSGLRWMLEAGKGSGLRVFGSVPSSVPASPFECGGAVLDAAEVAEALRLPGVLGLAEMMNYPGVLNLERGAWEVLDAGYGGRIDGHAAGVAGRDLQAYAAAGPHSDHEATTPEEARERLRAGLWLMVREGSAARNLEALLPVLRERPRRAMLVSDDVSVDELLSLGHLDRLLRACVAGGLHPADAVALVTCNPAEYWGLHDLGLVAPGYHADFVLLRDLERFEVLDTFVGGVEAQAGSETPPLPGGGVNLGPSWATATFEVPASWPVMQVRPDQITTGVGAPGSGDARLVVADRYGRGEHAACWTSGTGLTGGALAISLLHDAHHVAVLGGSNADVRAAGRALEAMGGGVVVVAGGEVRSNLPLPYAGLMSDLPPQEAAARLSEVTAAARVLGCTLPYPVTTLSFLGLSVIPALKLTPRGLLDVGAWQLLPRETVRVGAEG